MAETVERAHAKLSPSSSDRWLECPATLVRSPDVEDTGSDAAHEGTAAHALAEHCLVTGKQAVEGIVSAEHARWDSPEFRAHVQTYLDYVRSRIGDGDLFVEQRLQIFGRYGVWGTADAVIVHPDGIIEVIDLKFGRGLLVDADDNTQLILYGIGGLGFDWLSAVPVHTVRVHIVQPRRSSFPSAEYPVEMLANWVKENEHKIARAFRGTDEAKAGAHCRWCPVKGVCPERAEANLALASFDFKAPEPACTGKVDAVTEEQLVSIFTKLPEIRQYLDDVEAEVARRAHEREVKGVKWIAGRVTRTIIDPVKAAAALEAIGIKPYAEPKLLGITALEAMVKVGKRKLDEVLGDALGRSAGKPVLVAESHKSPAVTPTASAQEDFK